MPMNICPTTPACERHNIGTVGGTRLDYRRVLGLHAWRALPRATRHRFNTHTARYEGVMHMRASRLGWLFAWLATVVGSPLPKIRRAVAATTVQVSSDAATGGSRWLRSYRLAGQALSSVETVKAVDCNGRLVERLPGGLRMELELFVKNRALHFRSTYYYFEWGGLRLRLPSWCPPGCTEVIHRDLGAGRFRFTMHIRHPRLGELFHHDGVFAPPGDRS